MAYDEYLSERINRVFKEKRVNFEAKKMMGGLCYLVDEKMCVGIVKEKLMVRLDPDIQDEAMTPSWRTVNRPPSLPMRYQVVPYWVLRLDSCGQTRSYTCHYRGQ